MPNLVETKPGQYDFAGQPGAVVFVSPDDNTYVVETTPDGLDQHEHGAKVDAGKADLSLLLLFGEALTQVGVLGTIGAEKYTYGGWQGVDDGVRRYTAAMVRHLMKENLESHDEDTGVLHATAVAWNALARLELMLRKEQ